MNTYHLKYFVDAVRTGRIAQSAQLNHVTSASISQAIKALENELGVKLLHHARRLFQVTDQGQQVFESALKVLDAVQELRLSAQASEKVLSGTLKIGCSQTILQELMLDNLSDFSKSHPKVKVQFDMGSARLVKKDLREGHTELGFILDDKNIEEFNSTIITQGQFVLVGNKGAPDRLLITGDDKVEVKDFVSKYHRHYRKVPKIEYQITSWGTITKMAAQNIGWALVPSFVAKEAIASKKVGIWKSPFDLFKYEIKCLWPRNKKLSRIAQAFLDHF